MGSGVSFRLFFELVAGLVCVLSAVSLKDRIGGLWLLIVVEADILLSYLFGNFEGIRNGQILSPVVWATEDVTYVLTCLLMRQQLWNPGFMRARSWWRISAGGLGVLLIYAVLLSGYDVFRSGTAANFQADVEIGRRFLVEGQLISTLGEDLLYWGSLYPLMRARIGPAWATILVTTTFAALHDGLNVPAAVIYGVVASCLRDVSGGIIVAALAHLFLDAAIPSLPVLLVSVVGDRLASPYLWWSLSLAVLCLGCLAIGGQNFFRRFAGWSREWRLRPIKEN